MTCVRAVRAPYQDREGVCVGRARVHAKARVALALDEGQQLDGQTAEIVTELRLTNVPERAGRAQDKADTYAMEKLRREGYM